MRKIKAGMVIKGQETQELLEDSIFRPEYSVGYDPEQFYQHKGGFLFAGRLFSEWDEALTAINLSEADLPAIGISSYFPSLTALLEHRERWLIRWLNDRLQIAPAKLAEGIGQHILGDDKIKEFFETHVLLDVATAIAKKLGTLFYKAPDGSVLSVNAPQLVMPELEEEYRNRVYIRQRFDSVEHLV